PPTSTLSLHDALPISPTVMITSPANGSTVSGTITVSANAADSGSGVHDVLLELDHDPSHSVDFTSAPYSIQFNTQEVGDGQHLLDRKSTRLNSSHLVI